MAEIVDRIYQASLMEYANGARDYDNEPDTHSDGGRGLEEELLNNAFNSIMPYKSKVKHFINFPVIEIILNRKLIKQLIWEFLYQYH